MLKFLQQIFNNLGLTKRKTTKYRYGTYIPYDKIKWRYYFTTSCKRRKPYTITFPEGVSVLCHSSIGLMHTFTYIHDWKLYGDYRNHRVILVNLAHKIVALYKKIRGGFIPNENAF